MGTKALLTHTKTTLTILALIASLLLSALNPGRASAEIQSTPVEGFPTTNGVVYDILPVSDGSVYVTGSFTQINGVNRNRLARILPDNTVDPDFDPNLGAYAVSLAFDPNSNTLYVGGWFSTVNGGTTRNYLAAFDGDTGIVTAFNPNISGSVASLALNSDSSTLYVGGLFSTVNGGTTRNGVAAFNTSTGNATSFNPNIAAIEGNPDVREVLLDVVSNTLYVGGWFSTVNGGTTRNSVAAFNTSTGNATSFNPNIGNGYNAVYALTLSGNKDVLYATGDFNTVNGGTTRNSVAAFNTSTGNATSFNPNIGNGGARTLALNPTGIILYVGGSFTTVNGGTTRNYLAALDLDTGTANSFNPNLNSVSSALAFSPDGDTLYAGGSFTKIGDSYRTYLAAFQDPDLDNDGTPNTEEQAAPNNGDANNDSIPDSQQANVTSILNTDSNEYVTIVSPSGTTLSTTTAEAAPTEAGFTHLFGLTGFTISGVTPGDTIEVSLFYPNPNNLDPTDLTPKKYFPSTTSYQDLPTTAPTNTTITEQTIDGQPTLNLTYNLTDGGDYDLDNTADGQITDPVSLASTNPTTTTETTNTSTSNQDTLAETGQSQTMILITSMLLVSLATTAYTYRKRQDI